MNQYVCQLPLYLQFVIERRLRRCLSQEYKGVELEQLVADGMCSRVCDLQELFIWEEVQ